MMTRAESRVASAEYLNSLSLDVLFDRFKITRIARIDGLDVIGVSVYSTCRPAGRVISVNAGKSQVPEMARSGAVAEAIEYHTWEHPFGDFTIAPLGTELNLPLRVDCQWKPEMPIALEHAVFWKTGVETLVPSEMIWMIPRVVGVHRNFIRSTNGQACGATFKDAFLQGLYEVVERDQVSLRRISIERLDIWPPRVAIPDVLGTLADKCAAAGLKLYLFSCTLDVLIPVYMAILVDQFEGLGTFAGWGCHLSDTLAAERAILEAIQSRAVYISGARDDILRRDFYDNQERDPKAMIAEIGALPAAPFPDDSYRDMPIANELSIVLGRLTDWHDHIYFKHIDLGDLHTAKTMIFGMEQPNLRILKGWRSVRWEKLRESYDLMRAVGML